MPTGSLSLLGSVSSLPIGTLQISPTSFSTATGLGQRTLVNLSSGNNTITIPTGYSYVILNPPPANTATLVLKGVSGDTGIQMHSTRWAAIPLGTSATLVINASASVTDFEITWV